MPDLSSPTLPISPFLPEIRARLSASGTLVLIAEPGAGKTSLVPSYLAFGENAAKGSVIVLVPRRIAAVSAARRAAELTGNELGGKVGYAIRQESRRGPDTRLLFLTEALLTRMIQADPGLEGVSAVVFDEFHERSIHADLAFALALECRALRPDLLILAMSATMDPEPILAVSGGDSMRVPGRAYPIETSYAKAGERTFYEDFARGVASLFSRTEGDVLAFLPGMREIRETERRLKETAPGIDLRILHGSMPIEDQRDVVAPKRDKPRRIVLSTNVAETSLTVPGVTAVADSGLVKAAEFLPRLGMDRLVTKRITQAEADQRKGRAGRLGPGLCVRFWNGEERLVAVRAPEIETCDLSPAVLECLAWGAQKRDSLPWVTVPPEARWEAGLRLLRALGMADAQGKIATRGTAALSLGLHPRLAAMVLRGKETGRGPDSAFLAAYSQERAIESGADSTDSAASAFAALGEGGRDSVSARIAREAERISRAAAIPPALRFDPGAMPTLLAAAYPDRIARREGDRYRFPSGREGTIKNGGIDSEWIVAHDLDAGDSTVRIYSAAPIGESEALAELLPLTETAIETTWNGWKPRVAERTAAGALVLKVREARQESVPSPGMLAAARVEAEGLGCLPLGKEALRFLARARRFAAEFGPEGFPHPDSLSSDAREWLAPFVVKVKGELLDAATALEAIKWRYSDYLRDIDSGCPDSYVSPAGLRHAIEYPDSGDPYIEVKIQEMFGAPESPRSGGRAVVIRLLSPAMRPLQITSDLASFWRTTYPEIRNPLKSRYPRHYWPENPLEAEPTRGTKPRKP